MGRRALLGGRAPLHLHLLLLCHAWALPPRDSQPVLPARLPAPSGQLALRLAAFGRAVVLRLRPDTAFLAPRLRLQRLGSRRSPPLPPRRGCFYAGAVEGSPESPAVLSSCGAGGLSAAFLLDGAAYELQPLGLALPGPRWRRMHRLRRRSAPPGARPAGPAGSAGTAGPPRRTPRFVSQARYVETLLVADASMVRFYGEDVEVRAGGAPCPHPSVPAPARPPPVCTSFVPATASPSFRPLLSPSQPPLRLLPSPVLRSHFLSVAPYTCIPPSPPSRCLLSPSPLLLLPLLPVALLSPAASPSPPALPAAGSPPSPGTPRTALSDRGTGGPWSPPSRAV